MRKIFSRQRLSMFFALLGIGLMGVDLLLTGNFFSHIGELMAASIFCFILALLLEQLPSKASTETINRD